MGLASRRPVVAVIGASGASEDVCAVARQVGRGIAGRGWHLVCGGGSGVMEAACEGFARAARDASAGICIGVLPGDDPAFANRFVELAIPTGIGWARNAVITRMADAVIAIGGCAGTLSEIAFAWQMGKPLVAMASTGGWAARLAGQALDSRREDRILEASGANEAVELIAGLVEGRDR